VPARSAPAATWRVLRDTQAGAAGAGPYTMFGLGLMRERGWGRLASPPTRSSGLR